VVLSGEGRCPGQSTRHEAERVLAANVERLREGIINLVAPQLHQTLARLMPLAHRCEDLILALETSIAVGANRGKSKDCLNEAIAKRGRVGKWGETFELVSRTLYAAEERLGRRHPDATMRVRLIVGLYVLPVAESGAASVAVGEEVELFDPCDIKALTGRLMGRARCEASEAESREVRRTQFPGRCIGLQEGCDRRWVTLVHHIDVVPVALRAPHQRITDEQAIELAMRQVPPTATIYLTYEVLKNIPSSDSGDQPRSLSLEVIKCDFILTPEGWRKASAESPN